MSAVHYPIYASFNVVIPNEVSVESKQLALESRRILIAEDSEDSQYLISLHLRKAGAEVEIAENGQIALNLLESAATNGRPFDLLLSDMQMPVMDGYALASTIRVSGSDIPIVALTALTKPEDLQKCLDAGCDDYACKPIRKVALIATCYKWLQSASVSASSLQQDDKTDSSAVVPQSDRIDVLISELADDRDMAPLVERFVSSLQPKIASINECFSTNRFDELAKLAHQLKGSGGGYGFPSITETARNVERFSRAEPNLEQLQIAVQELNELCDAIFAGATQSRNIIPIR